MIREKILRALDLTNPDPELLRELQEKGYVIEMIDRDSKEKILRVRPSIRREILGLGNPFTEHSGWMGLLPTRFDKSKLGGNNGQEETVSTR